jgi:hypothetical protein
MPDRLDFRQRQLFHLVEVSRQAEGLGLADLDGEVPVACHFLQHDVLEQLVLSRGEPDSLGNPHLDVAGLCDCGHGDLLPSTRQSSSHGLLKASNSVPRGPVWAGRPRSV